MIKLYSKKQMLLCSADRQIFYQGGKLYIRSGTSEREKLLVRVPMKRSLRILSHVPLAVRVFRISPRCAAWVERDTFLIALKGAVYRTEILEDGGKIFKEFSFPPGMQMPIYFSKVEGNISGFPDGIYCGSYTQKPGAVRIWRRDSSGKWSEQFFFAPGTVLHIHNIIPDPGENRILILTGDSDEQAGIWEARDGFQTVRKITGGGQKYRSCFAFLENGHLIYATDAPEKQNYLYTLDEQSGNAECICPLPGSVINGAEIGSGKECRHIFSTAVETDSTLKGLRYLFSEKLASGIQSKRSHVFLGSAADGFREIAVVKKDALPMGLFQFGTVLFPSGMTDKIFLCPQASEYAGKTLEVIQ